MRILMLGKRGHRGGGGCWVCDQDHGQDQDQDMNADPIGLISILMLGKRYHREGIWAAPDSWLVTGGSVGLTLDEKVELYLRLWR